MMDIGILGPLSVRRDGTPIDVRAAKQRTVLLRLVLDVGQSVSNDRLLDDVWDGQPPPQGLVTLRSYISNLRSALHEEGQAEPLIVSHSQGYSLALPPESIDAVRFERLAQRGQTELAAGDVRRALASLERAISLWRGPALQEVADKPFAKPHIVRLEELRLGVEEGRFDALLRVGRHVEALPALEAFVARYPLRERAWAHLVLAQYRSGRAPDALESHRSFRDLLADELGLDPSPAFRRLADLILQQAPELDHRVASPLGVRAPAATPHSRLVGRESEREELVAALGDGFDGHGRLILVSGPAGIGKTALLQDFAAHAVPNGAQVHWGRCPEVPATPAFWPWVQVIRSIADVADDERLGALLAGVAAGVTQLVPELARRVDVRPAVAVDDPATARFRQFEAVVAYLQQAVVVAPLVILVDDLHWADDPTLDLLAFLAPQLADLPMVVVATFRDLVVDHRADLGPLLAGAARADVADHVELGGLTEVEVADLLDDLLDAPLDADQLRLLHERTDGNPFFVRQLARLLDGAEGHSGPTIGELPAGIRHILQRRLDRLPEEAQRVLEAAAVLGRDFDLRHVALMLDNSPGELVTPIDTAVEHGLVEHVGPAVTWQRFVHALVREVLYHRLPPTRAGHLHAAAATALEQGRSASPQEVAEHYWRAAEWFADDRPVRATLAAAHEAAGVLAYEQADKLMRRARELVGRHPDPSPALELHVRLQHLSLANSTLTWTDPAARDDLAALEELAGVAGIGADLVGLWWRARTFASIRGEHETAVMLSRILASDAERRGDMAGRAAGHVGASFSLSCLGDAAGALMELEQAGPHLDALSGRQMASFDLPLDVVGLASAAIAHVQLGGAGLARAMADRAVRLADERYSAFSSAYARLQAGLTAAMLEEPDEAHLQTGATSTLCQEHGFTMLARLAKPVDRWASAHLAGDASAQVEHMTEAVGWITAAGHHHLTPLLLGLVADVHLLAAQTGPAQQYLVEARAVAEATGERFALRRLQALADVAVG
jgi:DNA-binding SARP family transcriptional activator